METTNSRALLLSQSYEVVKVISWRRAITLLVLNKVEVIEEFDEVVRSPSVVFKLPAVVRLLGAFRRYRKPVKFSRMSVYGRDKYRCQYCGKKKQIDDLTYDHVVPRSQGGKTVWTNIVAACVGCNAQKGDRTPEEAGMRLRSRPKQPRWVPAISIRVNTQTVPDAWHDYLAWATGG